MKSGCGLLPTIAVRPHKQHLIVPFHFDSRIQFRDELWFSEFCGLLICNLSEFCGLLICNLQPSRLTCLSFYPYNCSLMWFRRIILEEAAWLDIWENDQKLYI
jgi:hypothetical protein